VTIDKKTNGTDNPTGTGPKVAVKSTVTWTYLVTNTGNVPLSQVAVNDDKAGRASCPATMLAPGASMTCTLSGKAIAGQYTNTGTVTATSPTGASITANDVDHYFGLKREKRPPTCTIDVPGDTVVMTFKDKGSGIVSLDIVDDINLKLAMPTFTAPSKGPLVVTGTRINRKKSAGLTIKATDFFGNVLYCDPVYTTVTRLRHDQGVETFDDIPQAEHFVTVENDSPGLRRLDIIVNGQTFTVRKLDDYDIVVLDVSSAMQAGSNNTITLVPYGTKGDSAMVVIADH
jgi:hypothetical protein